MDFGDAKKLFSTIATTKIQHFAAYARTLDAAEFRDILLPKLRFSPRSRRVRRIFKNPIERTQSFDR
jgi:hypothetical protein